MVEERWEKAEGYVCETDKAWDADSSAPILFDLPSLAASNCTQMMARSLLLFLEEPFL
ncbi:MAG: hypothetical protein ACJAT6_000703 [Akkermansiaceae bacterium]